MKWSEDVALSCVFEHMRRRHSSHNWEPSAAEASVKAARSVRAAQAGEAKRRAFTDAGAEGTPRQRPMLKP